MGQDRKICVGIIAGPHGVRGLVRLHSFMEDPYSIEEAKPLTDEAGKRSFVVKLKSAAKDFFIAEIEGVDSREKAEALRSTKLYVARSALPKEEKGEYYEADLIGLGVFNKTGCNFGTVRDVHNYGAGTFLEIGTTKKDCFMLPFTDACVPEVDMKLGRVVIDPPEGWMDEAKPEEVEE